MTPSRRKLPSYRRHKATGQARVTLSGRDVYLGPYGTKLSRDNYDRVVSEWLTNGRTLAPQQAGEGFHVVQLLNAFRKAGIIPPSHADAYKAVIATMNRLYGRTLTDDFGPVALKVVRQKMVEDGLKRRTVNDRTHIIRRIVRWGVEHQMVTPNTLAALKAVEALKVGRTTAPESIPIEAVNIDHVNACMQKMTPTVAAMVRLQLLTGMRAGELCAMRTGDIEARGDVWVYRPGSHKTKHLGKVREIPLGPQAIEVVKPYLRPDLTAYVFSPTQAEAERLAARTAARVTPHGPGRNAPGTNRVSKPQKVKGDRYDTPTYRRAIFYAISQAFPPPPALARERGEERAQWKARLGKDWQKVIAHEKAHHWHPHQLRHTFAVQAVDQFPTEHVQRSLGHSNINVTKLYAKLSLDKAKEVARAIG